jgi:hypothetical protein
MENPGTNVDLAVFKNHMVDPMANFLHLVFLITSPENDCQDLKLGCTDASRRQLQSMIKIGV